MLVPLELLLSLVYGCPANIAPCKCTAPTVPGSRPILDCSALTEAHQFQAISGLSARPPVHYDQIVIRRSQLDVLPANAFGTSHANEYVIENNSMLETIESGAFGPNPNPKSVSIRSNPLLDSIPFEDLQTFNNVEILRLNDNRLTEVPDNAFDKMSVKCKEIRLQRNVILDMGPLVFRGLPALELVDLSENQLNEIPSAGLYFDAAPKLVDISKNKIVSLDQEAFVDPGNNGKHGAYAMHINLSGNNIQHFQQQEYLPIFQKMDELKSATDPAPLVNAAELLNGTNANALVARILSQLGDPQQLGPERTQLLVSLLGLNPTTTTTTTTTPAPTTEAPAAPGNLDLAALGAGAGGVGAGDFASIIKRVLAMRSQQAGADPNPALQALLGSLAGAAAPAQVTEPPTTTTTQEPITAPLPISQPAQPAARALEAFANGQNSIDFNFLQQALLGVQGAPAFIQPATTTTTTEAPTLAPEQPILPPAPASNNADSLFSRLAGGNQEALLAFLSSRFDLVPRGAVQAQQPAVEATAAPEITAATEPPTHPPTQPPTTTTPPPPPPTQPPAAQQKVGPGTKEPGVDSIKELKDRLLLAIRSNPEAAAVAAAAIRDAAKASSKAGAAKISPAALEALANLPGIPRRRVKRRVKRQAPSAANEISQVNPEKPNYSIDFTDNPIQCNCELKWLFDSGFKYSDQFLGMVCAGNKRDLFSLPSTHFSRC